MKKLVYFMVLVLAMGFSCKKKQEEQAQEPSPAPEVAKPAPEAPQPALEQWVYMEYEIIPAGQQSVKQKSWVKGKEFRMEIFTGGANEPQMISFSKGEEMYMLYPAQKMAMKMPMQAGAGEQKQKPPEAGWSKLMDEMKALGATVTNQGKQVWEGSEYNVWRVTNATDGSYVDYYVDSSQVARRFVYYDNSQKQTSEMRILKYEVGKEPGADAFTVPSNYRIQDMSKMPGMPH